MHSYSMNDEIDEDDCTMSTSLTPNTQKDIPRDEVAISRAPSSLEESSTTSNVSQIAISLRQNLIEIDDKMFLESSAHSKLARVVKLYEIQTEKLKNISQQNKTWNESVDEIRKIIYATNDEIGVLMKEQTDMLYKVHQFEDTFDEKESVVTDVTDSKAKIIRLQASVDAYKKLADDRLDELTKYKSVADNWAEKKRNYTVCTEKVWELEESLENAKKDTMLHLDEIAFLKKSSDQYVVAPSINAESVAANLHLNDDFKRLSEKYEHMLERNEKLTADLEQIQDNLRKKTYEMSAMEDEMVALKLRNNQLSVDYDRLEKQHEIFLLRAQYCYSADVDTLRNEIVERDERIERLIERIETFDKALTNRINPEQSRCDVQHSQRNSFELSMWDLIPPVLREQLSQLRKCHKEINEVVEYLTTLGVKTASETLNPNSQVMSKENSAIFKESTSSASVSSTTSKRYSQHQELILIDDTIRGEVQSDDDSRMLLKREIEYHKSQLKEAVEVRIELMKSLERADEALRTLKYRNGEQKANNDAILSQAKAVVEECEGENEELHTKLSSMRLIIEKLQRQFCAKECEVARLESNLALADVREEELRHLNDRIKQYNTDIQYWRRKYEKRENFLLRMERILNFMSDRLLEFRKTNGLRQRIIECLKEFLSRIGYELSDNKARHQLSSCPVECAAREVEPTEFLEFERNFLLMKKNIEKIERGRKVLMLNVPDWRNESLDTATIAELPLSPLHMSCDNAKSAEE